VWKKLLPPKNSRAAQKLQRHNNKNKNKINDNEDEDDNEDKGTTTTRAIGGAPRTRAYSRKGTTAQPLACRSGEAREGPHGRGDSGKCQGRARQKQKPETPNYAIRFDPLSRLHHQCVARMFSLRSSARAPFIPFGLMWSGSMSE